MISPISDLLIRPATLSDSASIGRILAQGWRQAYSGFMPEEELGQRVNPAHRKTEIEAWLSTEFDPVQDMLLVAEYDGEVSGFVAARLGDRNEVGATGQITLLYVSPDKQARGIGLSLLREAAEWLKTHMSGSVTIAAFEQNPFRSTYDDLGGQKIKTIMIKVEKIEWPVVLYLWPSPTSLQEEIRAKRKS